MSLFNKTDKKEARWGSIPKGLGIKQDRADEIIEAVMHNYAENTGSVSKVFEEIIKEKLSANEHSFACYILGCVKVETENKLTNGLEGLLDGLEAELEKLIEGK